jgi:uncharacterized membrane protein
MILGAINYIYYRFYLAGRLIGDQSIPKNKAISLFMVFQMMNVLCILFVLTSFEIRLGELTPIHALIFFILLAAINFAYFFKTHQKIERKYKDENHYAKRKGYIILIIYLLVSVVALIVSLPKG